MGAYIGVGGGKLSAAHNSQEELRKRGEVDRVEAFSGASWVRRFVPYIETISEIFTPPRSTGVHFYFARNMRERFVNLIYSKALPPGPITSLSSSAAATQGEGFCPHDRERAPARRHRSGLDVPGADDRRARRRRRPVRSRSGAGLRAGSRSTRCGRGPITSLSSSAANGAGKSTTIKAIAGILPLEDGEIGEE